MDRPKIENLITEENLCELLGISKNTLNDLRYNHGFPYMRINKNSRIYFEEDVMMWLSSRRTAIGIDAEDTESHDKGTEKGGEGRLFSDEG